MATSINPSRVLESDQLIQVTDRDPVNITVYGNPVLDVIVDVGEGSAHLIQRAAIEKAAAVQRNGNLEFKPDTYVSFASLGEPILWGPFNPKGQEDRYIKSQKYKVPVYSGEAAREILKSYPDRVTNLPGPHLQLGGGGANVLFGFYDVFAQLKVELIATVEKRASNKQGRLDDFIKPLTDRIGPYTEVPIYDEPGINLVIEGLGYPKDRIIFAAELPVHEELLDSIPAPRGRAIMVNSLYSPQVAIDALAYACSREHLGFLALTKTLCSKAPVDANLFERVLRNHSDLKVEGDFSFGSIHDFITKFVLPLSGCICVLNDEEIEHLTDIPGSIERGETKLPTLGGVIDGLKRIRSLQGEFPERIYVTLGAAGSMVLNEKGDITYCDVVEDLSRRPVGKTAIGDTYATFLLALETIGNYIRPYNIPAQDVIKGAAAGADSGVYDGFGNLAVNKVNNFLGEKKRRLLNLGKLDAFPCDSWKNIGILDMRASDWDSITRGSYMESSQNAFVPGTLQEVIGRAFLRL